MTLARLFVSICMNATPEPTPPTCSVCKTAGTACGFGLVCESMDFPAFGPLPAAAPLLCVSTSKSEQCTYHYA